MDGIVLYSFRQRSFRRLTTFGEGPRWLPDGRRLLFTAGRKVDVVDASSGQSREAYSAEPNDLVQGLGVSADGRAIWFSLKSSGEEIWTAPLVR